jgi:hypothetical protein
MRAGLLRRRWPDALVVVATWAMVVAILWPEIASFRDTPTARRELVGFTSALTLGMPRADVVGRVGQGGRVHLKIADVDTNLVLVRTPDTFGAGNWIAWLDFTGGRLSSIRIRTADSVRIKPTGSPSDVGVPPAR